jgi:inner membrane protein
MDSLTQIVLGAAVGEVVLGKKIGNRAMIWGAIAGTIPDLDVLGKFFLSSIENITFHRGISHSISFSIVGAFLFGYLVYHLYEFLDKRRAKPRPKASLRGWQWLFFWALFTHPILDCFTMYGTELFAPFSDARIAWATISVADPLYTLPFLICLIIAAFFKRESKQRRILNYTGIALSSAYLLFTVVNKQMINQVFEKALEAQNIPAIRHLTGPTILNNILWTCIAETEDAFYSAQYSWFDKGEIEFVRIEKNHELVKIQDDPTVLELRKFSKDYYTILPLKDNIQFNDLRFGTFFGKGDSAGDFPFRFLLNYNSDEGAYQLLERVGGPEEGKGKEILSYLWNRICGKKKGV